MSLTFEYTGRDSAGKSVKGKLQADSSGSALTRLRSQGVAPLSLKEAGGSGLNRELALPTFGAKVKLKDLAVFSRQFATMINSGLSLLRALTILEQQTENAFLARALTTVRSDVETGVSLSVAMARHGKAFPPLMVNMVKAGEVGGFLDTTLLRVAENFEAEVKLRGKVKSAMTYPVVVFVMAILMCTGMLVFIVPTFAGMFKTLGGTLPLPTRILLQLSHFMKFGGPIGLVTVVALAFAWPRLKHDPRVRNVLDPLFLKVPIFGPLVQKIAISRFTRNLGAMLRAGVPILQSLDIVGSTAGNTVIAQAVREIQNSVRSGESVTRPLERHPVFPPMVVQMLTVGEDTGALDLMLEKIAEFYDQEVEQTTEQLTALIEPIMIAFLGATVGAMILALYMPIFKVSDLIK
ncbi:type IV pilus assembly protein PilC [Motilibacter rhizosphaerae]|uniref:Type IV pilus assembly protein PilC n=1 Tax=Motilibacter rhizosphaerae TaxID=598652 RepID=A0A4Q7NQW8_9ACTN|nr:type II secretion system F family protein [Motilibacter rhizosphaerae]RZS89421.1 type IV pilus assembly protein PilC [Motilibacter rhizosphaerae]